MTFELQEQLGDVVYVELPEEGKQIEKGDSTGAVESVKVSMRGRITFGNVQFFSPNCILYSRVAQPYNAKNTGREIDSCGLKSIRYLLFLDSIS